MGGLVVHFFTEKQTHMVTEMILLTASELKQILREELSILTQKTNPLNGSNDDQLLKRTDVAQMFDVTLVTVHAWMNAGTLPFHRMGGRTFFKKSEVIESLSKIKIRKK
ncbi:MAG: helix-turn-helix domain-containing protein [bacterium]|nr:helix-turn-helix domain-containing protein [bacterium]